MCIDIVKIYQIIESKLGKGKQFETAQQALDYCNGYVKALGPMAMLAGGVWGIKFNLLIPELEERVRQGD